jgi:glycosyltransferase involved in cell wall biosynthesis
MKLLFVTRSYPPLIGGMQAFSRDFYRHYQALGPIDLIANSRGRWALVLFFCRAALTLARKSNQYDVIHFGDASLSLLLPFVRFRSNAKLSCTVHGLDIVYSRFGYQKLIPFLLRKFDKIFAVSRFTLGQCEARGIPRAKLTVIPDGIAVDTSCHCSESMRNELIEKLHIPRDGKVLLTVGRLVRRKGHAWFISEVLTKLPPEYVYLVAGTGPELDSIARLVRVLHLTERVSLLGNVSEQEKDCLYQIADLFVMPNIRVEGDQEGFGIVILEAGMYGLPVIASNIEGITDTILERRTGRLVQERDAAGFVDAIKLPGIDRRELAALVSSHFAWNHIAAVYRHEFQSMLGTSV